MSKYIDQESALNRVGGSMALYKKLLGKFVDGNYQAQLEALVAEGNTADSMAMAHTIKGVAANLSLTEINRVSMQIESALKNGDAFEHLIPELREVTEATIEEIGSL